VCDLKKKGIPIRVFQNSYIYASQTSVECNKVFCCVW